MSLPNNLASVKVDPNEYITNVTVNRGMSRLVANDEYLLSLIHGVTGTESDILALSAEVQYLENQLNSTLITVNNNSANIVELQLNMTTVQNDIITLNSTVEGLDYYIEYAMSGIYNMISIVNDLSAVFYNMNSGIDNFPIKFYPFLSGYIPLHYDDSYLTGNISGHLEGIDIALHNLSGIVHEILSGGVLPHLSGVADTLLMHYYPPLSGYIPLHYTDYHLTGNVSGHFDGIDRALHNLSGAISGSISGSYLEQFNTFTNDHTLDSFDIPNVTVRMDKATSNSVFIPLDTGYPIGSLIAVIQVGVGATFITANAGVTVNGIIASTWIITAQFKGAMLMLMSPNNWQAIGGISLFSSSSSSSGSPSSSSSSSSSTLASSSSSSRSSSSSSSAVVSSSSSSSSSAVVSSSSSSSSSAVASSSSSSSSSVVASSSSSSSSDSSSSSSSDSNVSSSSSSSSDSNVSSSSSSSSSNSSESSSSSSSSDSSSSSSSSGIIYYSTFGSPIWGLTGTDWTTTDWLHYSRPIYMRETNTDSALVYEPHCDQADSWNVTIMNILDTSLGYWGRGTNINGKMSLFTNNPPTVTIKWSIVNNRWEARYDNDTLYDYNNTVTRFFPPLTGWNGSIALSIHDTNDVDIIYILESVEMTLPITTWTIGCGYGTDTFVVSLTESSSSSSSSSSYSSSSSSSSS